MANVTTQATGRLGTTAGGSSRSSPSTVDYRLAVAWARLRQSMGMPAGLESPRVREFRKQ